MTYATSTDVLARWIGEETPSDDLVTTLLGDAETVILNDYPDLPDRIGADAVDGGVPLANVVLVECQMVLRYLRNPDQIRSETTGPFSTVYAGETPGSLWMTPDERDLIDGIPTTGATAFTIDPTPQANPGFLGRQFVGGGWW